MKKRGLLIRGFGGWKSKTEQPMGPAIGENFMAHGFPVARVSGGRDCILGPEGHQRGTEGLDFCL